jgi:DNA-binding transcriptional ArsR family regulator
MTNALAFAALADPTRREVFEHLARGPQAVGELAQGLPVSRPAVSQHLKVLKAAGLVTDRPDGTRRVYQIDPQGLGQIRAWLDRFWDVALDAFKAEVERAAPDAPGKNTPDKEEEQP